MTIEERNLQAKHWPRIIYTQFSLQLIHIYTQERARHAHTKHANIIKHHPLREKKRKKKKQVMTLYSVFKERVRWRQRALLSNRCPRDASPVCISCGACLLTLQYVKNCADGHSYRVLQSRLHSSLRHQKYRQRGAACLGHCLPAICLSFDKKTDNLYNH